MKKMNKRAFWIKYKIHKRCHFVSALEYTFKSQGHSILPFSFAEE